MSERLALFELTYPVLVLYFLESQSLISVGEEDDTTILKAMFLQDILQYMIVPVCIGAQVRYLFIAPLQTGGRYPFTVLRAGQTMNDAVWVYLPPMPRHKYVRR